MHTLKHHFNEVTFWKELFKFSTISGMSCYGLPLVGRSPTSAGERSGNKPIPGVCSLLQRTLQSNQIEVWLNAKEINWLSRTNPGIGLLPDLSLQKRSGSAQLDCRVLWVNGNLGTAGNEQIEWPKLLTTTTGTAISPWDLGEYWTGTMYTNATGPVPSVAAGKGSGYARLNKTRVPALYIYGSR